MEQFIHVLSLTCIGEVVLLDPHLPVGHHISDDVFLWWNSWHILMYQ